MAIPHGASLLGRPPATSHAEIERAAFRLFAQRGFDGTTLDAIAGEVGISRRTLLRYYDSKNDIPWGRFAETLDGFRATLAGLPDDLLPRLVGQVSLALTLSAYTHWLDHPDLALHDLLDEAMSGLRNYLDPA